MPQRIGLITSKDGAAIGDFQINLGKYGYKISFIDSRVEGQLATQELLDSIRSFRNKDIDVLVLIRGGGSLESLLPFNNELLVREVADFPVPVLVGVGHEKDISLIGLAADRMVSTPTAAAEALNDSWQEFTIKIEANERAISSAFADMLSREQIKVGESFATMKDNLQAIFNRFNQAEEILQRSFVSIKSRMSELLRSLGKYPQDLAVHMRAIIGKANHHITTTWKILETYDHERQLKLGYSIVRSGGLLVRKIEQVHVGQSVDIRVENGSFVSEVKIINNNKK
ncbi:MAG: exodeoxyribonuclease VII large subunit [Candidatus Taylorbacteria bacterium]|nr:exodeoxyribonuclease VII large subunit [Candidatus Taylorbacteria bacterium]